MLSQGARLGRVVAVAWSLLVLALSPGLARATSYTYDANGRLVAVTNEAGESARYVYDVMGNIVRIERIEANALKIFAVTPSHGAYEAEVVLAGQGFSSERTDNVVLFNGTPAAVRSATANQLKVTVPYGATTGPLTVSVAGRNASSDMPFVVDETGLPPSIISVSPDIATAGDTLSVTGGHLNPIPGKTSLRLGDTPLDIAASSQASLSAKLPASASSGRVTVQTPYGDAESVETVLVVPPGIDKSKIASRIVTTIDTAPVAINVPGGSIGAVIFDSQDKAWASVQLTGVTGALPFKVYGRNNTLIQQGTISPGQPSIHLPRLVPAGTYLLLLQPAASASLTVAMESAALIGPSVSTLMTQGVSQSRRAVFSATAGDTLAFNIVGATTSPSGASVTYTIYQPSGTSYTSTVTPSSGLINLPALPYSGTYQVVAWPGAAARGSMQVQVLDGVTGTLEPDESPVVYDAQAAGQNLYLGFDATAFENAELSFSGVTQEGTTATNYTVNVFGPAGNQVVGTGCSTANPSAACSLHLWYLAAGHYSVVVTPANKARIRASVALKRHLAGRVLTEGQPVSVSLSVGQAERLTFTAGAGESKVLQIGAVATAPSGQRVRYIVYRPDAGLITPSTPSYSEISATGPGLLQLPSLPVGGTYTVIVLPDFGLPASSQITLLPGVVGDLVAEGGVSHSQTMVSGQSAYVGFKATPGQNLELAFTNVVSQGSTSPSSSMRVQVTDQVGRVVKTDYCYWQSQNNGCSYHLWNLAGGDYQATITAPYGGTLGFDAMLKEHSAGPDVGVGSPVSFDLDAGRVLHVGFVARAGETVALAISAGTTPPGKNVHILVIRPDAGVFREGISLYSDITTASSILVNLPDLPVAGRYELVVVPDYGLPATGSISLVPGVISTASSGVTTSVGTSSSGQSAYVYFDVEDDDSLELVFSDVVASGSSNSSSAMYVDVYDAAGRRVTGDYCYYQSQGNSCEYHLWNVAGGHYRAVVTARYGGTLRFNALLVRHVWDGTFAAGSPISFNLGAGEVRHFGFDAKAGETIALRLSGTTSTVSKNVHFLVIRPDAGVFRSGISTYADIATAASSITNLPGLPVSGRYEVVVVPDYGLPASGSLSLIPGVVSKLDFEVPQAIATFDSGQSAYLRFDVASGDNVALSFTNVTQSGASDAFNFMYVQIFSDNGALIKSGYCNAAAHAGSCAFHLWSLVGGPYRVVVQARYGGTLSFQAALERNLSGRTISDSQTLQLSLASGQVERIGFDASAGDSVLIKGSGFTVPAGQNVRWRVYRPDAGVLVDDTPAYSDISGVGAKNIALPNVPVTGRYTLIVSQSDGLPASGEISMSLTPGTIVPIHKPTNITVDDPAKPFTASAPAGSVTMSFDALRGDKLYMAFSSMTKQGVTSTLIYAKVYDPDGKLIDSFTCYKTDPQCGRELWNTVEGTYSATLSPQDNGLIGFNALVRRNREMGSLIPNVPVDVTRMAGDAFWYTFDANAGDSVALRMGGVVTAPAGKTFSVSVFRPDAGLLTTTNAYSTASSTDAATLNLPTLPASGRYSVVVAAAGGLPSTGSLMLVPGIAGGTIYDGATTHFAASVPGQQIFSSFDVVDGGNFNLTLSGITVSGSTSTYFTVKVTDPSGALYDSYTCYASDPSCSRELWNLPGGKYGVTIVLSTSTQMLGFDVSLNRNRMLPALSAGVALDVSHARGEALRTSFHASKGDTLALQLDGVSTTPVSRHATIRVYRPGAGQVTTGNAYTTLSTITTGTLNLRDLPDTGDYVVVVSSDYAVGTASSLTLFEGAIGTTPVEGVAQHVASNVAGQNIYFGFDAGQGGDFVLSLSSVLAPGGSTSYFSVSIFTDAGVSVDSFSCYRLDPACSRELWALPAGKYNVIVVPDGQTISFDAMLQRNRDLGTVALGTVVSMDRALGDELRMSFDAERGDTVALQLSGVSTLPVGRNVNVRVYNPALGQPLTSNAFASVSTTSSSTLNLANLPATGRYTVVAFADYGVPSTGTLTLADGITGTRVADGLVQHLEASVPGQNIYTSFEASPGDNLTFTFGNVTADGGTSSSYTVTVYDARGSSVGTYTCYRYDPGCSKELWNLGGGVYQAVIVPSPGQRIALDATLRKHRWMDPLVRGQARDISRGLAQTLRTSFNAEIGETVHLVLSGISSVPSGRSTNVFVFRPDGGQIRIDAPYQKLTASKDTAFDLPSLPFGGTYTVVVSSDFGLPAQGTLTVTATSP
jgi:YD repeat-containing protein